MKKNSNTGFGLIKAVSERAQKENSNFFSALKKLVNSSEEDLRAFLEMKPVSKYLKHVHTDKVFEIDPCDGTRTIANAKDIFKEGIFLNDNFLSSKSPKTESVKVNFYQPIKNTDYRTMFSSFCRDANKPKEIVFTQNQVLDFCEKYLLNYPYLIKGSSVSMPFKDNDEYFVAFVRVFSGLLFLHVYDFKFDFLWSGDSRHKVVVPANAEILI